MRLNLLSYAGGLGLVAGALLWPSASQAQGFCYMVDAAGRVINLDSLCASGGAAETPQLQAQPQGQVPGAEGALIEPQQLSVPEVRSFTLTGPPAVPGSSQAPAGTAPATTGTTPTPAGTTPATTGTTPSAAETPASPAGTAAPGRQTVVPGIEVPQIEVPQPPVIQPPVIQTPGTVNNTTTAPNQ
ncbi:hypothetical protein [Nodosilinea sp. PGN35]|uniref:hypothetical protein n=1 Tax=Nodosilinea sp. PGN35 TaxID=3020489 RepID=UPI0023B34C97|nr:hypothetical protein [Nodosilinea sp. TSF1-S3]MDF0367468.1 hypothetical protein [Nodosilinea sp. TSF1-S3]